MNFPVVETCGIDGFNETVATFREEGIDRFAIVLDPETYESCLVFLSISVWADQPEEHGNA